MRVSTGEERAYLKAMDAPGQAGPFIRNQADTHASAIPGHG
jgi:hypothetical protein